MLSNSTFRHIVVRMLIIIEWEGEKMAEEYKEFYYDLKYIQYLTDSELRSIEKAESLINVNPDAAHKLRSNIALYLYNKHYAKRTYTGDCNYTEFVQECFQEIERRREG